MQHAASHTTTVQPSSHNQRQDTSLLVSSGTNCLNLLRIRTGNKDNNNYDNVYGAIIMISHCESSPGSFSECRLSAGWPATPDWLGLYGNKWHDYYGPEALPPNKLNIAKASKISQMSQCEHNELLQHPRRSATAEFTCRLTAKNLDQLRKPTISNRV